MNEWYFLIPSPLAIVALLATIWAVRRVNAHITEVVNYMGQEIERERAASAERFSTFKENLAILFALHGHDPSHSEVADTAALEEPEEEQDPMTREEEWVAYCKEYGLDPKVTTKDPHACMYQGRIW